MAVSRTPSAKFGGVRTGGRSARVVVDALRATLELLAEHGYAALRFDDVAARSGVNKTTLYRRWPTKSQLVGAALREYKPNVPAPDTGDLEVDLVEMFLESMSRFDAKVTRGLMRVFNAERNDPEVDAILGEIRARIMATRRVRFDLAVARGELPRGTNVELLLTTMSLAVHSRLLVNAKSPSRAIVSDIVTIIVAGARVRWARTPNRDRRR